MAFIVIEGGEGVGKTTQIKLLKERLPVAFPKREFVFTKEPGGSPFAEKIRELILSDDGKDANPTTMLDLFMAARFDHVESVVAPALKKARWLCATDLLRRAMLTKSKLNSVLTCSLFLTSILNF